MRRLRRFVTAEAAVIVGSACALMLAGILPVATASASSVPTATTPATPNLTVGALFNNLSNPTQHDCTASVVDSPNGNVLLTAAHCISGSGAGYYFVPGLHAGSNGVVAHYHYGRWTVTNAYLAGEWVHGDRQYPHGQDPEYDFAFLTVAPQGTNGKTTVQQITGANQIGAAAAPGETATLYGYPAGNTSTLQGSNNQITCTNQISSYGPWPAFNCNPFPGGTSGSPWLVQGPHGQVVGGVLGGLHQGGCANSISYSSPLGAPGVASAFGAAYARAVAGGPGDAAPVVHGVGCH